MTHNDIYTKFMIEYDKANVTSSYPSLTEYEVATILDKAYNALIAQKITGNNVRRATFESDIKAISDLQPLIKKQDVYFIGEGEVENMRIAELPSDMLYYVAGQTTGEIKDPIKLVSHKIAEKFYETSYNKPWIKNPVCFIENNKLFLVYDREKLYTNPTENDKLNITYIKTPIRFATGIDLIGSNTFELNATMADELVSLAISYALESVESSRLNGHLQMRGLEA